MQEANAVATVSSDEERSGTLAASAASCTMADSIELNERVMTMLRSSASGKMMVHSQICANSDRNAQVIPRVATSYFPLNSSAARKASEVRPEREIMTA